MNLYPIHDPIIDALLHEEGWPRYTNRLTDRGGATKGGITLAALRARRPDATVADLQALPEDDARAIYAEMFVTGPGFDKIADQLLRWQVVDSGVPSGPGRATRWLQEAAGCKVDGQFGPATLGTVNGADPHRLGVLLCGIRLRFFGQIVAADHSQAEYIAGWINRATAFLSREAGRGSRSGK